MHKEACATRRRFCTASKIGCRPDLVTLPQPSLQRQLGHIRTRQLPLQRRGLAAHNMNSSSFFLITDACTCPTSLPRFTVTGSIVTVSEINSNLRFTSEVNAPNIVNGARGVGGQLSSLSYPPLSFQQPP